jgi:hypothetical protein
VNLGLLRGSLVEELQIIKHLFGFHGSASRALHLVAENIKISEMSLLTDSG